MIHQLTCLAIQLPVKFNIIYRTGDSFMISKVKDICVMSQLTQQQIMYFLFSSLPFRPKCLEQMLVLITLLSKPTMQSTYCCRLVKWLIFDSNNLLQLGGNIRSIKVNTQQREMKYETIYRTHSYKRGVLHSVIALVPTHAEIDMHTILLLRSLTAS